MSSLYSPKDLQRIFSSSLPESAAWRSQFRRDSARVLHSAAFRRLQGKTQLFAGEESEFFRNRLTHSLEVAQISKGIARKLNEEFLEAKGFAIDLDLAELAGLAHDLGHPPFGHTGEHELNILMSRDGGFEGNAQTLRILVRTEKKLVAETQVKADGEVNWFKDGVERGMGLNLCARSLAAILKYDKRIPSRVPKNSAPVKGYYGSEAAIVAEIRKRVGRPPNQERRTIECQIMDLADDIAYSTYDIEDAFRAGLSSPLELLASTPRTLSKVAERCQLELKRNFSVADVLRVLKSDVFPKVSASAAPEGYELSDLYRASKLTAGNTFFRGAFTSWLVNHAVEAVSIRFRPTAQAYSSVHMDAKARAIVSVLKHLVYVSLIDSPRMTLVRVRGRTVVREIFETLTRGDGWKLLPPDWADRYEQAPKRFQKRVVSDFVAGMTDRQALDFYARLSSSSFKTMFGLH